MSAGRARRILTNLALTLVAGIVALSAAEVGIRLFVPVRNVGAPVSAYDPVYGVGLKRNFDGVQTTPEFQMHLTTNSLGFRGPEPVEPLKDVLLYLGDSFTVGFGVNNGEEYPAVVDRSIVESGAAAVPYINAGRGNSGQGHWIKFLRSEATRYEPRVVVLQLLENDFEDNVREALFRVDSADSLVELPVPRLGFDRMAETLIGKLPLVANSHIVGLIRQARHSYASRRLEAATAAAESRVEQRPATPSRRAGSRRTREDRLLLRLVEEVGRICQANGWTAVAIRVAIESDRDAEIGRLLDTLGIRSARIPSRREMPELYYTVDGHWNAKGHAYAAETVLGLLAAADSTLIGPTSRK